MCIYGTVRARGSHIAAMHIPEDWSLAPPTRPAQAVVGSSAPASAWARDLEWRFPDQLSPPTPPTLQNLHHVQADLIEEEEKHSQPGVHHTTPGVDQTHATTVKHPEVDPTKHPHVQQAHQSSASGLRKWRYFSFLLHAGVMAFCYYTWWINLTGPRWSGMRRWSATNMQLVTFRRHPPPTGFINGTKLPDFPEGIPVAGDPGLQGGVAWPRCVQCL